MQPPSSANYWHPNHIRCQTLRVAFREETVVFLKWLSTFNGLKPQFATAQGFFDEFVKLN